jgi:hypothetical protein
VERQRTRRDGPGLAVIVGERAPLVSPAAGEPATGTGRPAHHLAVTAYGGKVFVAYGTRNTAVHGGNLVQQQISSSDNAGTSFGPPLSVGPLSNLTYAAVAGGKFPGDYIGASATASRLNVVWCRSSRPPNPNRVYHQTLYSAVLRP